MDSTRLALSFAACLAFASSAAADSPEQVSECASVVASARFTGAGYRHIVKLTNNCRQPVSCEVWTDVDPTPHYTLQATPGASAEVAVRDGSPATAVRAGKTCRFSR